MVNPNPSTKRYLSKDIFTHITAAPSRHISLEAAQEEDENLDYQTYHLKLEDTIEIDGKFFSLQNILTDPQHPEYQREDGDLVFGAQIIAWDSSHPAKIVQPVLAIKQQRFIYSYFDDYNDIGVRIRLVEEGLHRLYPDEQSLSYETYRQKLGDVFYFDNFKFTLTGFDKDPVNPAYLPKEGDIAVAAILEIESPKGEIFTAKPIFLIRDNRTFMIKEFLPKSGLTLRFASIDPNTELLDLMVARTNMDAIEFPIEIALGAPRDDFLVLEAIEFPGINLFWLGTTLMMCGMLLGMARRWTRDLKPVK